MIINQLVIIRPVKSGDQTILAELLSDRQTIKDSGIQLPDPDNKAAFQWALDTLVKKGNGLWLITERSSKCPAGIMSLVPTDKGLELGYLLGPAFRGRGLMTSAVKLLLEHLGQRTEVVLVTASTSPNNLASQRVLQRAGFQCLPVRNNEQEHCWQWLTQKN